MGKDEFLHGYGQAGADGQHQRVERALMQHAFEKLGMSLPVIQFQRAYLVEDADSAKEGCIRGVPERDDAALAYQREGFVEEFEGLGAGDLAPRGEEGVSTREVHELDTVGAAVLAPFGDLEAPAAQQLPRPRRAANFFAEAGLAGASRAYDE